MSDRDPWAAGTWEGARRAQIDGALSLTVRERLEGLDDLHEASLRLAAAGREPGARPVPSGDDRHTLRLAGCRPTPLASYLKALGILRLVAEQADAGVRGWWAGDAFFLRSRLDGAALRRFFLETYAPTPVLSPWNGGSGFHPKDKGAFEKGLGPIEGSRAARFAGLRRAIAGVREVLQAMDLDEKPDDEAKPVLLERLRATLDEDALAWLDAAVVLTEESPRYPPLLGTGGNDGRLEFGGNFLQHVVRLFDVDSGAALEATTPWLDGALFAVPVSGLTRDSGGQFSPDAVGGPNAGTGFDGAGRLNPWDFVLMLEGAVLFAAAATRRLEAGGSSAGSFPFTVASTGAGVGSADISDEADARGEIWMPLWDAAATVEELRAVLGEGRATVGGRSARDGVDFARAVATLGVARGIREFQRFGFLQRYGRTYLATPLNRVEVRPNPTARLIDELERLDWLTRVRRLIRDKDAPARLRSLGRGLDDALFDMAARGDRTPRAAQRVLIALGRLMRYLATSPSARERCPPVPVLDGHRPRHPGRGRTWVETAWDGTAEYEVAVALAGIHATASGPGTDMLPMGAHIAPVDQGRTWRRWSEGSSRRVVWGPGDLGANLGRVLERRLLERDAGQDSELPLAGWARARLGTVAAWLEVGVDEGRTADLLSGLVLVRVPRRMPGADDAVAPTSLPLAYRALKPLFAPASDLELAGIADKETHLRLSVEMVREIAHGRIDRALAGARIQLRKAGLDLPVYATGIGATGRDGARLLGALMVPIRAADLRALVEPLA